MKKLVILLLTALCLSTCKKDEIDPRQQILGKWELFSYGEGLNLPPFPPSGYREFLRDSVLVYDYTTRETITEKYWIDSFLHIGSDEYSYKFYADTLELRITNATAIFYVTKWKRIN